MSEIKFGGAAATAMIEWVTLDLVNSAVSSFSGEE